MLAIPYVRAKVSLKIISAVAPAPSQTWNDDCENEQWIELNGSKINLGQYNKAGCATRNREFHL